MLMAKVTASSFLDVASVKCERAGSHRGRCHFCKLKCLHAVYGAGSPFISARRGEERRGEERRGDGGLLLALAHLSSTWHVFLHCAHLGLKKRRDTKKKQEEEERRRRSEG